MKDMRHGVCALCNHHEVVSAPAVDFVTEAGRVASLGLTHKRENTLFSQPTRDLDLVYGKLTMYACRHCGFVQWFASSPASVPIGGEHATRLIKGDTGQGT